LDIFNSKKAEWQSFIFAVARTGGAHKTSAVMGAAAEGHGR
jgi:hypothetical protein